jgi:hypothetical protein
MKRPLKRPFSLFKNLTKQRSKEVKAEKRKRAIKRNRAIPNFLISNSSSLFEKIEF